MFRWNRLVTLLMVLSLGILAIPASEHSELAESSHTAERRLVTLAADSNYPPFEFWADSSFQGLNVDIIKAVGDIEGWDVRILPMQWKDAVTALEKGQVDGIEGMVMSDRFTEKFAFSDPYLVQEQAIFVRSNNTTIHSLADAKNYVVAVQDTKIADQIAQEAGLTKVIKTTDQYQGMEMLLALQADAVIGNSLTGIFWGQQTEYTGKVKRVGDPLAATPYGLATNGGNEELLKEFNDGLKKIKANGTYDRIQQKWFGQIVIERPALSEDTVRIIVIVAGTSLLIALLALAWNRTLKLVIHKTTAELEQKNVELQVSYEQIDASMHKLYQLTTRVIQAFGRVVEMRDSYTKNHSDRVASLALKLAENMGLGSRECELIFQAGLLHDIGKIGIPEKVLNKPGRLTDEEYHIIQEHPQLGYSILQGIPEFAEAGIDLMVKQHHERWDGTGYPDKLRGEQMVLGARILALADAWDAMTSARVYRPGIFWAKALEELRKGSGKQFDPELVEPFIRCVERHEELQRPVLEVLRT